MGAYRSHNLATPNQRGSWYWQRAARWRRAAWRGGFQPERAKRRLCRLKECSALVWGDATCIRQSLGQLWRGPALVSLDLADRHRRTAHTPRQLSLGQLKRDPAQLEPAAKRCN